MKGEVSRALSKVLAPDPDRRGRNCEIPKCERNVLGIPSPVAQVPLTVVACANAMPGSGPAQRSGNGGVKQSPSIGSE